ADNYQPGIFSDWSIDSEAKKYTFTIRKGLKWSDGHPVTTEDVEYLINDEFRNEEITSTPPDWLRWGGGETEFNIIDDHTFEIVFSEPYGMFIEQGLTDFDYAWADILRPKHYLKQFHKDYTDWEELLPLMEEEGYTEKDDWAAFYSDLHNDGFWLNGGGIIGLGEKAKDLPTLDPYVVKEIKDDGGWIFERNPYFYMVDTDGNQLPYIDTLRRKYVSDKEMINNDIIQGNTDVQGNNLGLSDYPMLKDHEEDGDYTALPVNSPLYQGVMYFFNLAVSNDVFPREVIQDLRFRKALSYALNREVINESVFLGMGEVAQLAPNKDNEVYEESMGNSYVEYDLEKAKSLLDDMGIVDDDGNGWREWQGEELIFPIEYYTVTPAATPGVEMAKRFWEDVGIRVDVKQIDVSLWWERWEANEIASAIWHLGPPSALERTDFLVPFDVNIPRWSLWWNTEGDEGIEPLPWAKDMYEARQNLVRATTAEEKLKYEKEIWELQAENIPLIGTVVNPPAPFVYSNKLGNIDNDEAENYTTEALFKMNLQWFVK
ncbi:MAG: ABC transporter substrate-binding protein, partial [Halanaerobiaceae bacterium]